jgi:hypothetical protein
LVGRRRGGLWDDYATKKGYYLQVPCAHLLWGIRTVKAFSEDEYQFCSGE